MHDTIHTSPPDEASKGKWKKLVSEYQKPSITQSGWQIINSAVGYILLWVLIYFSLTISWWLTAPLVVVAGGLLVRIFIIFHDCTHGSFYRSRRANEWVGSIMGVLCFTPYHHWKWEHSIHHSHAGDLDGRGLGDVWTLTVEEYLAAPAMIRLRYRLNRHPIVLFVLAPIVLFLILHRIPSSKASRKAQASVHLTNLAILALGAALIWIFGWQAYLVIQMAILFIAATAGVWLFYIQHQFEGVAWERNEEWTFEQAALQGSSLYKLPKILQWYSCNIGFHHIHHLSPRIPNYNLEKCHESDELFKSVPAVTLATSMKSFNYRLWDEKNRKLVNFDHLQKVKRERETVPN